MVGAAPPPTPDRRTPFLSSLIDLQIRDLRVDLRHRHLKARQVHRRPLSSSICKARHWLYFASFLPLPSLPEGMVRVVKKLIITVKSRRQKERIIWALKPGFLDLIKDMNGNDVIQHCLKFFSNEHTKVAGSSLERGDSSLSPISGIEPGDRYYSLNQVKGSIKSSTGYTPSIECNINESSNVQVYQIYMCIDSSGRQSVECPVYSRGKCPSRVEFPVFQGWF